MVYFSSDWLALHHCLEVQTMTYQCEQLKSTSAHSWSQAFWSYCYHPRQHCWIWRTMWQQQAQLILSGWVRATSWPYADPRSATRLLILHTPCRGKPGLKVRAWKIPVIRRAAISSRNLATFTPRETQRERCPRQLPDTPMLSFPVAENTQCLLLCIKAEKNLWVGQTVYESSIKLVICTEIIE